MSRSKHNGKRWRHRTLARWFVRRSYLEWDHYACGGWLSKATLIGFPSKQAIKIRRAIYEDEHGAKSA